jgi:LCP family protein required for cell wall assembly
MRNPIDQNTRRILPDTRPIQVRHRAEQPVPAEPVKIKKKRSSGCGCSLLLLALLFAALLLAPFATHFLLLGIDRAPTGSMAGRSDTMIVFSINPLGAVRALSIPRDLWVPIPDFGENRINAAHFFAEAEQPGRGPASALNTLNSNFGFRLKYYLRFNLENFPAVVDALGGMTLSLSQTMSGYPPGDYPLDGTQALAFVRSRSDGDDFFRMAQGQVFIQAFIRRLLDPAVWPRLPQFLAALPKAVDTNIPWLWPRLGLTLARAAWPAFDSWLSIAAWRYQPSGQMAQILLPDWALINYLGKKFR